MPDERIWTIEEVEAMSPDERQKLLESHIVYDLDQLDPEVVARLRGKGRALLEERGILPTESG